MQLLYVCVSAAIAVIFIPSVSAAIAVTFNPCVLAAVAVLL